MNQLFYEVVGAIQKNAASVMLYINCQLPYPFIQIISAVVYMFLIQLFLVCSSFVSHGISTGNKADIITGLLTIILYNFVLLGLLRLFDVSSPA